MLKDRPQKHFRLLGTSRTKSLIPPFNCLSIPNANRYAAGMFLVFGFEFCQHTHTKASASAELVCARHKACHVHGQHVAGILLQSRRISADNTTDIHCNPLHLQTYALANAEENTALSHPPMHLVCTPASMTHTCHTTHTCETVQLSLSHFITHTLQFRGFAAAMLLNVHLQSVNWKQNKKFCITSLSIVHTHQLCVLLWGCGLTLPLLIEISWLLDACPLRCHQLQT